MSLRKRIILFRTNKKDRARVNIRTTFGAVVAMAQLVEWSLPTPKVYGSNPIIGKILIEHLLSIVLKRLN